MDIASGRRAWADIEVAWHSSGARVKRCNSACRTRATPRRDNFQQNHKCNRPTKCSPSGASATTCAGRAIQIANATGKHRQHFVKLRNALQIFSFLLLRATASCLSNSIMVPKHAQAQQALRQGRPRAARKTRGSRLTFPAQKQRIRPKHCWRIPCLQPAPQDWSSVDVPKKEHVAQVMIKRYRRTIPKLRRHSPTPGTARFRAVCNVSQLSAHFPTQLASESATALPSASHAMSVVARLRLQLAATRNRTTSNRARQGIPTRTKHELRFAGLWGFGTNCPCAGAAFSSPDTLNFDIVRSKWASAVLGTTVEANIQSLIPR